MKWDPRLSYLLALTMIVSVPYVIWRLGRTDRWVPLVVIQIVSGILLGPAALGEWCPNYYALVFPPIVIHYLTGIAWWGVMVFVMIAGIELDIRASWAHRRDIVVTAGLGLLFPLVTGAGAAALLLQIEGWRGPSASPWQFMLGVGMACSVTAIPILVLFLEHLGILRSPWGQRILRYASLDDVAIWAVLSLILMDMNRLIHQALFLIVFLITATLIRWLMPRIPPMDRWYVALIWLALASFAADIAGLHFMVGAFLSGMILDMAWFDERRVDQFRHWVLLILMPVFFLMTGLRTDWQIGGAMVFAVALMLLIASVGGKLAGIALAGKILKWKPGEANLIGWLLQTKALIMIIFANILLDKEMIQPDLFTALLLMAIASTVLTMPIVGARIRSRVAALKLQGDGCEPQ